MVSPRLPAVVAAVGLVLLVAWFAQTRAPSPSPFGGARARPSAALPSTSLAPAMHRDAFEHAIEHVDWTAVTSGAPDPRLDDLDPGLVDGHEPELRNQLATATPRADTARNVGEIARRARTAPLRFAAVDALGRMGGDAAKDELLSLLTDGSIPAGEPARRAIAPALRPAALSDPIASRMAALLDSGEVEGADKDAIAFTLARIAARDGSALPADVMGRLSPVARALLARAAGDRP